MANSKESFEILEDTSGNGVAASSTQAGDASTGKTGMSVFPFVDPSGVIRFAQVSTGTPLLSDQAQIVRPLPYEPQTYSASASAFVPPASATDVFTIIGSATKTIRIHKIRVTGSTTAGGGIKTTFQLIKRSTLNTAGTRIVSTNTPHDSTNAAATANCGHYTVNPTVLGTSVGTVRSAHVAVTNTGLTGGDIEWNFEALGQPVVLRGVSEVLAINLNGVTIAGPIFSISVEWSEVA
jgi:hypothetical protein